MTPHEETWELHASAANAVVSRGERGAYPLVAITKGPDDRERAGFIAAAPAMARALLAYVLACPECMGTGTVGERRALGVAEVPCTACDEARTALKEAGVLE
jgi:hypothetical protein